MRAPSGGPQGSGGLGDEDTSPFLSFHQGAGLRVAAARQISVDGGGVEAATPRQGTRARGDGSRSRGPDSASRLAGPWRGGEAAPETFALRRGD